MLGIEEVRDIITAYGKKIDLEANSKQYPIFAKDHNLFPEGSSIYIDGDMYHYVIMERGNINRHYVSPDLQEILFYIFDDITFSLACEYEVVNRKESEDSRRQLFARQLDLLEKIDGEYKKKCEKEIERILSVSPFNDENYLY